MDEMVKNFQKLSSAVQEALLTASELAESDFIELSKYVIQPDSSYWLPKIQDKYPIAGVEPEAFYDGFKLRNALFMIFTCDHASDWEIDLKNYEKVVTHLNEKYGVIALSYDSTGNRTGYGIAAHRLVPFAQVLQTTYDENHNPVTVVDNVQERIDRQNKENRYGTL